jgi:hypothetical protein
MSAPRRPRTGRGRAALALAAWLTLPAPAAAQLLPGGYDPAYRWQTIQTGHFQVHFHQGEAGLAQRVAGAAERAHARLAPLLGHQPSGRTQIVLSDDTDDANGSATPLPRNIIRLYAVPPESASVLHDEREWLTQLVEHEYVHILHLDNVGGLPAALNHVFGKLLVPNALTPPWLIEGLAVVNEGSDEATGRNASALFEMYARAMAAEPPGLPSLAEVTNQPLLWPRGHISYLLGGRFMAFLVKRNGWEAMRGFLADQGSQIWPWAPSWQSERWFGADLPDLWDEFRAVLQRRAGEQLAAIRTRPVTRPRLLTRRGASVERPRWAADGASLVYLDHGPDERGGLRRVGSAGQDLGLALPVELHGLFALRADGQAVVSKERVWKEFRVYDDLWLADLGSGGERRLTEGERATDPALTPDGTAVVYVARTGGGEMELRRRRLDGGPAETLLRRPGAQLYDPAVSPDGRRIALSIQEEGRRDLALLEDGALRLVTDDDALDLQPAWTPDGRYLLFASDRGGVFNLYAWAVADGTLRRITNVETGALDPAVSPDGRTIAFITAGRSGHDVATIPFDPDGWLDPPAAAPRLPAPPALEAPPLQPRPYRPTTALPTFWLPLWSSDAAGTTWGAYTAGSDVVGLHTWQAQGWWSPRARTFGYALAYAGGWSWPALDLLSERLVDGPLGSRDQRVTAWTPLAGGATFSFTQVDQAALFRLGWSATRLDALGAPRSTCPIGDLACADAVFPGDGLLSEASLGAAWSNARRYPYSISPEEGRSLSVRLRLADRATGSAYDLWRARAAWTEYQRLPLTSHAVLAGRVSLARGHGSIGGGAPFSLGGVGQPNLVDLFLLQSFAPGDQLRGYPSGAQAGNGTALLNLELRFPLFSPALGWSTWPLFLRRVHGALFADLGEAFVQGLERDYWGPDFHWKRLRLGAGAELRLETVLAYWLVTDLRLGGARGLGKPFGRVGPGEDALAEWQVYLTFGPSF